MSSLIGSATITVKPEVLSSQAKVVRQYGTNMRKQFDDIEAIVKRTEHYWLGEAGEKYRKKYLSQVEEIQRMLNRIMEHPDDLEQIAGNYKEAEIIATSKGQALPENILE